MAKRILSATGVRGMARSVYYSIRHAGRPDAFLLSKNSSISLHPDADISIENVLSLGVYHSDIMHHSLGGPRLQVHEGGSLTAQDGIPHIGPGSVVNVQGDFRSGDSYINGQSRVFCKRSITIGDGCSISWDVDILDSNGGHSLSVHSEDADPDAPVSIGDDVWIGHGVTILPGVSIGDNSIVAAKSLVNRDVPDNSLVGGIPAEVIYDSVSWD